MLWHTYQTSSLHNNMQLKVALHVVFKQGFSRSWALEITMLEEPVAMSPKQKKQRASDFSVSSRLSHGKLAPNDCREFSFMKWRITYIMHSFTFMAVRAI